ncbi:MAG: phosphatidylinositol kinase [Acidobacteriia bacterium]|nr:phosphatidylinositol kinase [Terriglobia bacterium]
MALFAVQHVRRMRGGAQAHLMRASDGNFYVVKFQNNPQHPRVLANDFIVSRLAERVGLPVPQTEVMEVEEWLVKHTPELTIQLARQTIPCQPGLQFGSRFVVDPAEGQVFDYLPETSLAQVKNLTAFAGALALDKWTCNTNGRQAAFWRKLRERKYHATFIDQGYCFNAGEWTFPDAPLCGVYLRNEVYEWVRGWDSFEPWLSRLEQLDAQQIWQCAEAVPPEWYGSDFEALERLVASLVMRRARVRALITEFRHSSRQPFPYWTAAGVVIGHA